MRSKKMLALLLVGTMALGLTACGSKNKDNAENNQSQGADNAQNGGSTEAQKVHLKVWVPENQIQTGTITTMCQAFNELHPEWDLIFTVEAQGEDTCKENVLKDVAAAADVYFFASDQLQELVNAGAIARLGGDAERMVKEEISEAVTATVTAEDGNIYGIPFTHNTFFMYYDKSILDEDDIESMERIMAKETADNVYNFCFDTSGGWKLGAWYYGAGLHIYGESQRDYAAGTNWNNETGLAVTNYLIDLINSPKCAYADDVNVTELATERRLGAWFDGAWNYNAYKKALGDDLGVAKLPTFNPDGNDYQLLSFYSSKAIGVNPQSAHLQAAVALAAYLGNEENQRKRYEETAQIPANTKASASEQVQQDVLAQVIVETVNEASVMQPANAEFSTRYWTNAGAIATEIRNGTLTKQNAQERLDLFRDAMQVE
ncbi:MAG: extracellular solute-binding protein [Lachnospiraceae bacterium]|nr:extracellular solute-binding protein [Lachnospiraceae bacterium]